MPNRVYWTTHALDNAKKIKGYIETSFGANAVDDYYSLLIAFENAVSAFPQLYPISQKQTKIRRAVLSKALSAYYVVGKNTVDVLAVLDNRMDNSILL